MKEQSLQDEVNRYSRLSEIILAVSSAEDLDVLLTESIQKIYTIFSFDTCWLALLNRDSISYSVQQIFNAGGETATFDGERATSQDCLLLNVGLCGWVIENQQMHLSGDWQPSKEEVIVFDSNHPPRSVLALPLQVSKQTIGAIAFTAKKPDYFEIADLEMAVTFTVHMALAIDRWKQAEQLIEMNKDLEQKVQQRTQQLRMSNRSLQQQIAESHKTQKDLQHSRELFKQTCQAQSELLEKLSEKLQIPLNLIIENVSIVLNYYVDKDRDYELLDSVKTAAKKTLTIMDSILKP